ncbi:MAG: hypothetical protein JKY37_19575, partial [Nannocystaceae bacterium]|nr:hypothetical protein [Nannocystaceae bacterium]
MIGGRAWRTLAGIGALLLTVVYLVSWWTEAASPSFDSHGAMVGDGPRIVDIRPDRPTPGGTVVVRYTFAGPAELAQSQALILQVAGESGRLSEPWQEVEPISRSRNAAVFRLPSDLKPGIGNIRLEAGGRVSEVRVLRVAASGSRKVLRNLLGGLGLVLLGLAVFSHAFRRATGSALIDRIAGLCSSGLRSVVAGASAGGLTQLSSFAATV